MTFLSATVGQKFAFASGRTGVLRQDLMTRSDVDRLLGSHDLRAMEQILTEIRFTNGIDQGVTGSERILAALQAWVVQEVKQMTSEATWPVFDILWISGDAPLLAWALKRRLGLTSDQSRPPVSGLFAYGEKSILAFVGEDNKDGIPDEFVRLKETVLSMEKPDARSIDAMTEQAATDVRLRTAKKSGSKDIVRFVKSMIDLGNIRTALRLGDVEDGSSLLRGGTISVDALREGKEAVRAALRGTRLSLRLGGDIDKLLGDPLRFERAAADLLSEDIARMWHVPLTVEPVFAFAALALSHIALIRAIAIGKRSALSPQDIKLILPPFISPSRFSA